ncbi:hypothetical protein [Rhodopila sp.]|jgi:hypothetical protein|uniref:hypothetical protein n=1 Tax=Rhodopila sp. TaxID=2480087 RepID=UPI002D0033AC|nr:hypothetical protein [Rhodopila sp.]HVZ10413.1 hypothetical protein [Rhodopila sp.]
MSEPEWRRAHHANWDKRVPLHAVSTPRYGRMALRAGRGNLGPIVTEILGPLQRLTVLYLQCHFGKDALT